MATDMRIGVQISVSSGSVVFGFPIKELPGDWLDDYGLELYGPNGAAELTIADVESTGGGSYGRFGDMIPPGDFYGLQRGVSAATPWTVWFKAPLGSWTNVRAQLEVAGSQGWDPFEDDAGMTPSIKILSDKGGVVETIMSEPLLFASRDNGAGDWLVWASSAVEFEFVPGPRPFANFWTNFTKSEEFAPPEP